MKEKNIEKLFQQLNKAIENNDENEFTKIAKELWHLVEWEMKGYNMFTKIIEDLIYGGKIKLVDKFIKESKVKIDKEVLLNQIDRKKKTIYESIKQKMEINENNFEEAVDQLYDVGLHIYDSYKKLFIKPSWKSLKPEDFIGIYNLIFTLPDFLITKKLSNISNYKYNPEMFKYTNELKYNKGIAFYKGAELTAEKFNIPGFNLDSYLRILRNYNSTKIIPAQKRK